MKSTLIVFSFLSLRALVQGQCENAVTVSTLPFTATGSIGMDSPLVEATGAGTCPVIWEGFTRGDWYELEGTGECRRVKALNQGTGLLSTAIAFYKDEGADCEGLVSQSCVTLSRYCRIRGGYGSERKL